MEECSSTAFFFRVALRCVVVSHVCTCNMDECSGIAYIFAFLVMRNSIQTHTAAGSCLEQQSARAPCGVTHLSVRCMLEEAPDRCGMGHPFHTDLHCRILRPFSTLCSAATSGLAPRRATPRHLLCRPGPQAHYGPLYAQAWRNSHRPRKISVARACCRVTSGQATHGAVRSTINTSVSRSVRRSGSYIFGDYPSIRWPFRSKQQDLRPSAFRVGCAS